MARLLDTFAASASTGSSHDELMTADRSERKHLVSASQVSTLLRGIDSRLQRHIHGETRLPGARLYTTTVYFDTESRHLFHQAEAANESVKLRAREYYALDPSMVQLARHPDELMRSDRVLWFELKHKRGGHVRKRRFGLPKPDVPAFLADGRITDEMVDVQAALFGDKAREVMLEVSRLCQHYREPFGADCIVNYRRNAWQDDEGLLRLTLDRNVRFYRPPADLWSRNEPLSAESLGDACGQLDCAILEIKSRGEPPDWLEQLLCDVGDQEHLNFSKFVTAARHVHAT